MQAWNSMRATAYGGAIGLSAALVKSLAPWSDAQSGAAIAKELIGATLAFALLRDLAAVAQFRQGPAHGVAAVGWAKSSALLVGHGHRA